MMSMRKPPFAVIFFMHALAAPLVRADVAKPGEPVSTAPELPELSEPADPDATAAATRAMEQQDERNRQIGVKDGPGTGEMEVATITVPAGYVFADGAGAKKWAELVGNPISGKEIGLIGPKDRKFLVLFQFDDVGRVQDDDEAQLDDDADALLAAIQTSAAAAVPPMRVVGWEKPPRYDAKAKKLEWGVIADGSGDGASKRVSNFHTRLLGRRGVVSATLIFEGETKLADVTPAFLSLLEGFSWKAGEAYGDHRPGDRIATYGLRALVAGSGAGFSAMPAGFSRAAAAIGGTLAAAVIVAALVLRRRRRH